jgi:hypothetical protein
VRRHKRTCFDDDESEKGEDEDEGKRKKKRMWTPWMKVMMIRVG